VYKVHVDSTSITRTTCYLRPREDPRPTRPISSCLVSNILARMSRGCYTRKTGPVKFQLMRACVSVCLAHWPLNRSKCRLGYCILSRAQGSNHAYRSRCTLAPPGEYDWTISCTMYSETVRTCARTYRFVGTDAVDCRSIIFCMKNPCYRCSLSSRIFAHLLLIIRDICIGNITYKFCTVNLNTTLSYRRVTARGPLSASTNWNLLV